MGNLRTGALAAGALRHSLLLPKASMPIWPDKNRPKEEREKLLRKCSDELYEWQRANLPREDSFVLHDGPPYANGNLHMGHALNKILKDIVGRFQVLSGRQLSYIPGWDCHGLPIELKALQSHTEPPPANGKKVKVKTAHTAAASAAAAEKGKTMDAVEIRALARGLADKTVGEQMAEFRSWGVMGDWENHWKTMDKDYEISQLRVFKEMLKRGLIYRRFKPVFWSPSSGTALAEAELEYNEKHVSKAAFVAFPIRTTASPGLGKKLDGITVRAAAWTTTPWTIPANKAIAVNKEMEYCVVNTENHGKLIVASERAAELGQAINEEPKVMIDGIMGEDLVGAQYSHPLLPEDTPLQPVLSADFVTADSGTGLVHCAPGHGMDDYLLCQKHGIQPFSPVDSNGRFTEDALPGYGMEGLEVLFGGTKKMLEILAESKVLLALQPGFTHKYPYDWRTKRPIIVRATAQWFADVGVIKDASVESLENIEFVPPAGRNRLTSYVNSRSEWCISRQRAWGAPIPALYDVETDEPLLTEESVEHIISILQDKGTDAWWGIEVPEEAWTPESIRATGKKYIRGKETMDVWFDSGTSWATLKNRIGQREGKPLADLYLEGSDQHRGWFQSSLLTSVATSTGLSGAKAPYGMVVTHGFCLDEKGKKMSKSLGNTMVPADVIQPRSKNIGGIDALRLWVASCDYTKDVSIGNTILDGVNENLRKLRVTLRFLLGNLEDWDGKEVDYSDLTKTDRYALAQLYQVNRATAEAYKNLHFNRVNQMIVAYTNSDLSAFYLDVTKDSMYSDPKDSQKRRGIQTVMYYILRNYLSILTPIVPLLTQEVWSHASSLVTKGAASPTQLGWYRSSETWNDETLIEEFKHINAIHSLVKLGIEKARAEQGVKVNLEASAVLVAPEGSKAEKFLKKYESELPQMFIVSEVSLEKEISQSPAWQYVEKTNLFGDDCTVVVQRASGNKCPRCWVYTAEQPDEICDRCQNTITSLPKEDYESLFA
ncbi:isoleucyl-tRNA synthetase [Choiromyces venosus 120613-1]|uniref:Isoleucine--tRNA ligase, mitochondrial n=1 Tax=Choiromyces venosus 120613-1 TaxID=1336337 RepID=A0A3N4JFG0_9PEZI|nr:isoleucyl-tRNA synthetase [Choiromyces venosus 120613-1]